MNWIRLLLLLLLPTTANADCECLWRGSFTRVQADTDLVVSARIVNISGNSMDLSVAQILRGTLHNEDIRVWLDTGDRF